MADNVAIGHDDEWRLGVGLQEPHRLAGLDDERLVLVHFDERLDDSPVRRPVARRLAECCIDDEIVRILADRKHVFQEPQQRFLPPALGAQLRSTGDGKTRMTGIGLGHRLVPLCLVGGVVAPRIHGDGRSLPLVYGGGRSLLPCIRGTRKSPPLMLVATGGDGPTRTGESGQ